MSKSFAALLCASTILSAAPALAQQTATASDDAVQLGDIVVTAQRTESLASKTPIALTAIGGEALRSAGVTNPIALSEQVPNISIVRTDGLRITIRGVTSNNNTEKGDPSAAFLADGVYIARPQAQEVSFFDVARVEVLRGPQGTLYGRNTTAGVVNVITNRPGNSLEGAVNATVGDYDTRQVDAFVNLPVNDALALRFSGSYDRRDSYLIQNAGDPYKLGAFKNNLSGRAQALIRFGEKADLLLKADYASMKGNPHGGVAASAYYNLAIPTGQPAYTDPAYIGGDASSKDLRRLRYGLAQNPRTDNDTWGLSAELNWDLGPLAATYLGSYREFDRHEDTNSFVGRAFQSFFTAHYQQNSQELRFATTGEGPFKTQFGAYYFDETAGVNFQIKGLVPGVPYYGFPQDPITSESWGLFGQTTWSATPDLRLTVGARYSHDDKEGAGFTTFQQGLTFNPATDARLLNYGKIVSSKTTWRVGVDYDLSDSTMVYGSISTGYKAGGFNDGCEAGVVVSGVTCNQVKASNLLYYQPETLTAYDAGLKGRFLDNRLRAEATAFYYDYQNLQLSTAGTSNGAPVTFTGNAAKAKVKGLELSGFLAATDKDRLELGLTWLRGEYENYLPLGVGKAPDYSGRRLDRSPETVWTLGYQRTQPLANGGDIELGVRSRISAAYKVTVFSQPRQYAQPAYSHTDAHVTYNAPDKRWYVGAFAKNLENEVTVNSVSVTSGQTSITPGDPRTVGVRTGVRF